MPSPEITDCETTAISYILDGSFDPYRGGTQEPPPSRQRLSPESPGGAMSPERVGTRIPPPSLSVGGEINCQDTRNPDGNKGEEFKLMDGDFLDQLVVSCVMKVHERADQSNAENPRGAVIGYLVNSYARTDDIRKNLPVRVEMKLRTSNIPREQFEKAMQKLLKVLISYCSLAIADPDFCASDDEDPQKSAASAAEVIADCLRGFNGRSIPPPGFLNDLAAHCTSGENDIALKDVFLPIYNYFWEYLGRWHRHLKITDDEDSRDPSAAMRRMMQMMAPQSSQDSSPSEREPCITDSQTYNPEMQALATLSGVKPINTMLVNESLWNPIHNGEESLDAWTVESKSLMGRVLGLGPSRQDFRNSRLASISSGTSQSSYNLLGNMMGNQSQGTSSSDLVRRIAETTYPDGGMSMPDHMLQANCVVGESGERKTVSPDERQVVKDTTKTITEGIRTHVTCCQPIVDGYLRRGARKGFMDWLATVLKYNRMRSSVGFLHHGRVSNAGKLSSHSFLMQLGKAMIKVCSPFLDPTSNLASKIDIRFVLDAPGCGNELFSTDDETKMCSFDVKSLLDQQQGENTDAAAGDTETNMRWLDSRNPARIKQFESQQKASAQEQLTHLKKILSSKQGEGGLTSTTQSFAAGHASNDALRRTLMGFDLPKDLERPEYGTVSQFFFTTALLLHVGVLSSMQRHQNILRSLKHVKDQRKTIQQQARNGDRRAQMGLLQATDVIEKDTEELLTIESYIYDEELLNSCMSYYRAVAVLMIRTLMRPLDVVAAANGEVEQPLVSLLNEISSNANERSKFPLPMVSLSLPLPLPTQHITTIPEFMVEDVFTFIINSKTNAGMKTWVSQAAPLVNDFLSFLVMCISSPLHLSNPYIRGKAVQAIEVFVPLPEDKARTSEGRTAGHPLHPFFQHIANHQTACLELTPALGRFWVDIETTGSHTQFYDKVSFALAESIFPTGLSYGHVYNMQFTFRASCMNIMEFLWDIPAHRQAFIKWIAAGLDTPNASEIRSDLNQSSAHDSMGDSEDVPFQLRFGALVLSDILYHMEEAFKALEELKELQQRGDTQTENTEDNEESAEEARHRNTEMAKWSLRSATMVTDMLAYLASEEVVSSLFLGEHLRGRTAEMLMSLLSQLVGKSSKKLKVANMDEIGFNPRKLLLRVTRIFNNLGSASEKIKTGRSAEESAASTSGQAGEVSDPALSNPFLVAVVKEERFFKIDNFYKACKVLKDSNFLLENPTAGLEVERFEIWTEAVAAAAEAMEEAEGDIDLDDVPEEFLDPLMFTIMNDPVRLPTSDTVMDKQYIVRHLLDNPQDPFNREHLTSNMLQPQTELKQKIQNFLKDKRAEARSRREKQ